jgi:hypothetical protein
MEVSTKWINEVVTEYNDILGNEGESQALDTVDDMVYDYLIASGISVDSDSFETTFDTVVETVMSAV